MMPRNFTAPDHHRPTPLPAAGLLLLLAFLPHPSAAQGGHSAAEGLHSAYAGQQDVAATGLLPGEVEALEQGRGMAQALPAEVNGYPGPRHLLDAADQETLDLRPPQRQAIERIYQRMHDRAVGKGAEILEAEAELARRFRHRHVDPPTLTELAGRIARLRGELRAIHLTAHLETTAELRPEQISAYQALRGYEAHSIRHARHPSD
jgi:hypothetical protein